MVAFAAPVIFIGAQPKTFAAESDLLLASFGEGVRTVALAIPYSTASRQADHEFHPYSKEGEPALLSKSPRWLKCVVG